MKDAFEIPPPKKWLGIQIKKQILEINLRFFLVCRDNSLNFQKIFSLLIAKKWCQITPDQKI